MVAEDPVSQGIDSENGCEKLQTLTNPHTPMFVANTGVRILATEKIAASAAMNAVKDLDLPSTMTSLRACRPINLPPLTE